MFDEELHCKKCLGKSYESEKTCYSKVLKTAPKSEKAKERTFQNKCPKCGKIVYITLGFEN